jgi:hypothetical protein
MYQCASMGAIAAAGTLTKWYIYTTRTPQRVKPAFKCHGPMHSPPKLYLFVLPAFASTTCSGAQCVCDQDLPVHLPIADTSSFFWTEPHCSCERCFPSFRKFQLCARNARKYRYIGPTATPSERSTLGCFQCDQTCLHDQEYLNAGLLRLENYLIRLIVAATSLFERCFPCFCNCFIHRLPSQCVVIGNDGHFFKMGVLCLYAICAHGQGARCEQLESPVGCLVKGHVLLKTNMRTAHSMMHRKPTESIV